MDDHVPLWQRFSHTEFYDTAKAVSAVYVNDLDLATTIGLELSSSRTVVAKTIDKHSYRGWELMARTDTWENARPQDIIRLRTAFPSVYNAEWFANEEDAMPLGNAHDSTAVHNDYDVLDNTFFLVREILRNSRRRTSEFQGYEVFDFVEPDKLFTGTPFESSLNVLGRFWLAAWVLIAAKVDSYKVERSGYFPHLLQYVFPDDDIPSFWHPEYITASAYFVNLWRMLQHVQALPRAGRETAMRNIQNTSVFMAWFPGNDLSIAYTLYAETLFVEPRPDSGRPHHKRFIEQEYLYYRFGRLDYGSRLARKPWMLCFISAKSSRGRMNPLDVAAPTICVFIWWLGMSCIQKQQSRNWFYSLAVLYKTPVELSSSLVLSRALGIDQRVFKLMRDLIERGMPLALNVQGFRDDCYASLRRLDPPVHYKFAQSIRQYFGAMIKSYHRWKPFHVFTIRSSRWFPVNASFPSHLLILPKLSLIQGRHLVENFEKGFKLPAMFGDSMNTAVRLWPHWYDLWLARSHVVEKDIILWTQVRLVFDAYASPEFDGYRRVSWTSAVVSYGDGEAELFVRKREELEKKWPSLRAMRAAYGEPTGKSWLEILHEQERDQDPDREIPEQTFTSYHPLAVYDSTELARLEFGFILADVTQAQIDKWRKQIAMPDSSWHRIPFLFDNPYRTNLPMLMEVDWVKFYVRNLTSIIRPYMMFFVAQQKVKFRRWLDENRYRHWQAFRGKQDVHGFNPYFRQRKNFMRGGWRQETTEAIDFLGYIPGRSAPLFDEFLVGKNFSSIQADVVKFQWTRDGVEQPDEFVRLLFHGELPYREVLIALIRPNEPHEYWFRQNFVQIMRENKIPKIWQQFQADSFTSDEMQAYTGFNEVHSQTAHDVHKRIAQLGTPVHVTYAPGREPVYHPLP